MAKNSNQTKSEREVEVLYQRLGDRVFAFSLVDDDVFFGEVPNEAIEIVPVTDRDRGNDQGQNV